MLARAFGGKVTRAPHLEMGWAPVAVDDAALAREHQAFARIGCTQAATSMVQQFVNDQFIKGKGKVELVRYLGRKS